MASEPDRYNDPSGWMDWKTEQLFLQFYRKKRRKHMALKLFGTEVSGRSILETQVHTVIETVGGIGWLALTLAGHPIIGAVVWFLTLEVEHIFALAAGKDA